MSYSTQRFPEAEFQKLIETRKFFKGMTVADIVEAHNMVQPSNASLNDLARALAVAAKLPGLPDALKPDIVQSIHVDFSRKVPAVPDEYDSIKARIGWGIAEFTPTLLAKVEALRTKEALPALNEDDKITLQFAAEAYIEACTEIKVCYNVANIITKLRQATPRDQDPLASKETRKLFPEFHALDSNFKSRFKAFAHKTPLDVLLDHTRDFKEDADPFVKFIVATLLLKTDAERAYVLHTAMKRGFGEALVDLNFIVLCHEDKEKAQLNASKIKHVLDTPLLLSSNPDVVRANDEALEAISDPSTAAAGEIQAGRALRGAGSANNFGYFTTRRQTFAMPQTLPRGDQALSDLVRQLDFITCGAGVEGGNGDMNDWVQVHQFEDGTAGVHMGALRELMMQHEQKLDFLYEGVLWLYNRVKNYSKRLRHVANHVRGGRRSSRRGVAGGNADEGVPLSAAEAAVEHICGGVSYDPFAIVNPRQVQHQRFVDEMEAQGQRQPQQALVQSLTNTRQAQHNANARRNRQPQYNPWQQAPVQAVVDPYATGGQPAAAPQLTYQGPPQPQAHSQQQQAAPAVAAQPSFS